MWPFFHFIKLNMYISIYVCIYTNSGTLTALRCNVKLLHFNFTYYLYVFIHIKNINGAYKAPVECK